MLPGSSIQFETWLIGVWLFPAAAGVFMLLLARNSNARTRRLVRSIVAIGAFLYLLAVVAITFYPFQVDISAGRIFERGNWIPGQGTLGFLTSSSSLQVDIGTRDFVANLLLFTPLGLLFAVLQRRWRGVVGVIVLLGALSLALEVVQGLTISGRTLDIDDAIAGAIGALAASLVGAFLRSMTARPSAR